MELPELKKQILEHYKDKIAAEDFEILMRDEPPSVEELEKESAVLDFLGPLGDFAIWATRKLFGKDAGIVTIIVTAAGAVSLYFAHLHPTVVKSYDYVTTYIARHIPSEPQEQPKSVWFYPDPATVPPTGAPIQQYASSLVAPVSGQFLQISGWAG